MGLMILLLYVLCWKIRDNGEIKGYIVNWVYDFIFNFWVVIDYVYKLMI